jgi:hypothetical protein
MKPENDIGPASGTFSFRAQERVVSTQQAAIDLRGAVISEQQTCIYARRRILWREKGRRSNVIRSYSVAGRRATQEAAPGPRRLAAPGWSRARHLPTGQCGVGVVPRLDPRGARGHHLGRNVAVLAHENRDQALVAAPCWPDQVAVAAPARSFRLVWPLNRRTLLLGL